MSRYRFRRALIRWRLGHSPKFLRNALADANQRWCDNLEREGRLASAVADVVWNATQYGTTEDGDTFAYIVPKGCMHRLAGVAQSNGAHVPVAFRSPAASLVAPTRPANVTHEALDGHLGTEIDTPTQVNPTEQATCEHGKPAKHRYRDRHGDDRFRHCPGPTEQAATE